jgi:amino acid transporter
VGAILGAGIYVLVGEVVAVAGGLAPWSFLIAALIAVVTAFSYAELSARFPRSAGEAVYVEQGFQNNGLTTLVGLLVAASGILSMAVLARGFVVYLAVFIDWPEQVVVIAIVVVMSIIVIWGISLSVTVICFITLVEIAGLVIVCFIARDGYYSAAEAVDLLMPNNRQVMPGVMAGAFLAFYAFIGFEDIVNIAEEVREPERNLPRAVLWSIALATLLYIAVSLVAVLALPLDKIAGSNAPMAVIVQSRGINPVWISGISLIAIVNGAMVQIIMASRVLYGMGRLGRLPAWFARVSARTRTPVNATIVVASVSLIMALWLPIRELAGYTSVAILVVFMLVNGALLRLKLGGEQQAAFTVPITVPMFALLLCLALLLGQFW